MINIFMFPLAAPGSPITLKSLVFGGSPGKIIILTCILCMMQIMHYKIMQWGLFPVRTLNTQGGIRPSTSDLQQRITQIYDHLYANAVVRTPWAISREVGKILHTAMYIEEIIGQVPAFLFSRTEISKLNGVASDLATHVAEQVKQHFAAMNESWNLYTDDVAIELGDKDISYVCRQLNNVLVTDRNRDVFGDALEIFRTRWAQRTGGQFFTDQRVTTLAMELLEFDPRTGDDLIDICAGTGGFLLAGLNHIRKLLEEGGPKENVETDLINLAEKALKGQEVDAEICEIANATLRARLSTVSLPFVMSGDSLAPDAFDPNHPLGLRIGRHLCAASNPPFGTKITIKDPTILSQFDLARSSNKSNRSSSKSGLRLSDTAPDILFLEQNIRMLYPGKGRLSIVLPYQILSGPQTLYIRQWLLAHAQILAVIDLPGETFQPHTGTKTCLLVVKRREDVLSDIRGASDPPIFMSIPRWIGHDRRGNTVYKRTPDGRITDEVLSDFDQVAASFIAFREGEEGSRVHTNSFVTQLQNILDDKMLRLNALFYKPSSSKILLDEKKGDNTWRVVRINDVVKRIFFPSRFKRNYVDYFPGAVPFLGGSNILQFVSETDKWLRPDDPKLETLRVKAGWILITRSGSTGIVSSVPKAWDGFAMSEHVIRIVPDPEKLDPTYLLAFLRTRSCKDQLSRGVFGSVIDEITPEFVGGIEILIPRSTEIVNRIATQVREAEGARQAAIEGLFGAVDSLNEILQD